MEEILLEKLYSFIVMNNPDLLVTLQGNINMASYLEQKLDMARPLLNTLQQAGKSAQVIEAQCIHLMTEDLRPSRYHYIRSVLQEEFEMMYYRMTNNGTLTYEIVNLLEDCNVVFDDFGFREENLRDRKLRAAIINTISDNRERMQH